MQVGVAGHDAPTDAASGRAHSRPDPTRSAEWEALRRLGRAHALDDEVHKVRGARPRDLFGVLLDDHQLRVRRVLLQKVGPDPRHVEAGRVLGRGTELAARLQIPAVHDARGAELADAALLLALGADEAVAAQHQRELRRHRRQPLARIPAAEEA